MTIYDLKLYGVYRMRKKGDCDVKLSQDKEKVFAMAPKNYRFEVTALPCHFGKKDVLRIKYVNGCVEYITLHNPVMYLDKDEWKLSEYRAVVDAFIQAYNTWRGNKQVGSLQ